MNPYRTCATCIHNQGNRCANEASRYHGAPLKSWNTCSQHTTTTPSTAELIARLATCAAGLDWRAERVTGDCRAYYGDRAAQCRKWAADLKEEGHRVDVEYIAGGLAEFEAIAL